MHGRIERSLRSWTVDALQDDGVVAHGAAHKAGLPGKGGCCAFAHDPEFAIPVSLAPGVVVVIVDRVGDRSSNDPAHALDDPFATRIGVQARKLHRGEVALP
jgi:hypothetical protein